MYSVQEIANYFIHKSHTDRHVSWEPVSNKKLQKLLYYAQAWYMVRSGGSKLFRDRIEAWVHGPAIPAVYGKYKAYGFSAIPDCGESYDLAQSVLNVLNEDVWLIYGKYDANYLEALTHSEPPWQNARKDLDIGGHSTAPINMEQAAKFYAELRDDRRAALGANAN